MAFGVISLRPAIAETFRVSGALVVDVGVDKNDVEWITNVWSRVASAEREVHYSEGYVRSTAAFLFTWCRRPITTFNSPWIFFIRLG